MSNRVPLKSPAESQPKSPALSQPKSPALSQPKSPALSQPKSPALSQPKSPALSQPKSPALSQPKSPALSQLKPPALSQRTLKGNESFHSVHVDLVRIGNSQTSYSTISDAGEGSVLSAHNINCTVKVATTCCRRSVEKQILFDVTGVFKKGMNAILGPTGSGKSTFLDVLAGRKDPSGVSGQLLLDGKPMPDNFKCMVGYVVQADIIMGTLSVKENFHFSAALRLPRSVSASEREAKVQEVIRELGLEKCADTKVGNEFIRGISGGERKRCSIGMELIIGPSVLFLDEPTTGLDAGTAHSVLAFLKRLSRKGRVIVFSIHQPRYSIYRLFDRLMLLSMGQTVYHGPARQALEFFQSQGYYCQEHNNPPDFFLDVINGDPSTLKAKQDDIAENVVEEEEEEINQVSQHDKLVEGFKRSSWNSRLQEEAGSIYACFQANGGLKGAKYERIDYATPFHHQVGVVASRALKNLVRNPQISILTIVTTIVFTSVVCAIYWQLSENPKTAFKDRSGLIVFLVMNQMFVNISALAVFITERKIFMHENVSGFYRVSVYFIVKVFFDLLPLRLIPIVILSCMVYFSVGLNPGADHFFAFLFGLFCVTFCAAGLCFLYSALVNVYAVAQLMLALSYIIMMMFGGFLIQLDSVGPWLHWAKYFSIFKYGLEILYVNEFKDRQFCNNSTCVSGNYFLEMQAIGYKEPWDLLQNYTGLLIYASCLFCLTYIQLRIIKKTT
ncbi:hypothetical protein BsWGS_23175 [Bradybaena similaris]